VEGAKDVHEVRASGEPAANAAPEPAPPPKDGGFRVPLPGWVGFGVGGALLGAALVSTLAAGIGVGVFVASYAYVANVAGNHRVLGGDVGRTVLVNATLWTGPVLLAVAMLLGVAGAVGMGVGAVFTVLGLR
jgi:hypothetical protein